MGTLCFTHSLHENNKVGQVGTGFQPVMTGKMPVPLADPTPNYETR